MIERLAILNSILRGLDHSPGVALLGPRQCGKTTLAREVAAQRCGRIFDLENPEDSVALENPMLSLQGLRGLVVLDEVQRKPELFPILRVLMDRPGMPAKFLLLGSASPFLVRGVTESLAGRVALIDLQGFSLDEAGRQAMLWNRGGFPRSFLAGNDAASYEWRRDFIRTFVEKDLSTLGMGGTPASLGRLWHMAAHYHGQSLNASELGRSLGESYKTIQRHLEMLEGAFMIRQLRPWFENLGKRLVKAPKLYVRDSGLLHALLGIGDHDALMGHPKLGASWEGFALEQILMKFPREEAWYWGTQGGAELDLMLIIGGKRWGFEFKCIDAPSSSKSMHSAIQSLGLEHLWVVYPGDREYALSERITVMPLRQALVLSP